MQVVIRRLDPYSTRDVDAWRRLYRVVFGLEFPEEVWRWKYLENPYNDSDGPLIYVAECDGQIVGANSFLPSIVTISHNGRDGILRACQVNNIMVHPDHRRKGLFLEILNRFVDEAPRKEYKVIYSYPNAQSLSGFLKMNWTWVGELWRCAIVIDAERFLEGRLPRRGVPLLAQKAVLPLVGRAFKLAGARTIPAKHLLRHGAADGFAGDIEWLNQRAGPRQGIHGPRGREFLSWRFRRPDRDYYTYALYDSDEMAGYLVVSLDLAKRSAWIEDTYAHGWDLGMLAELLSTATKDLRAKSCGLLTASLLNRDWPLKSVFSRLHGITGVNRNEHLVAYPLSEGIKRSLLSDRNNWYLQRVDRSPF